MAGYWRGNAGDGRYYSDLHSKRSGDNIEIPLWADPFSWLSLLQQVPKRGANGTAIVSVCSVPLVIVLAY